MTLLGLIALFSAPFFWISYGNPFKEVVFSGAYDNYNPSKAFFVKSCNAGGNCEGFDRHQRVMHFSQSEQVRGLPGKIEGEGRNPVALLQSIGLDLLPNPDFTVAALKWCTTGQIWQEFTTNGAHYIVELPRNPVETARCVKKQLPSDFDASIADPLGRFEDRELFISLRNK